MSDPDPTNVTGTGWSGTDWDYATVKYDHSGNQVWLVWDNNGAHDNATALSVDSIGNAYVTGRSYKSHSSPDSDYATIKYDSAGNQVRLIRYDNGNTDWAAAIALDPAGNIYVTGSSYNWRGNPDYATVRYNP